MDYIYMWSDELKPAIKQAMADENLSAYRISVGNDAELKRCLVAAIDDQLIDSHLEAVRFEETIDRRGLGMHCSMFHFDPDSLAVLVRRLCQPLPKHWDCFFEGEKERSLGDEMQALASNILDTLGMPAEIDQ